MAELVERFVYNLRLGTHYISDAHVESFDLETILARSGLNGREFPIVPLTFRQHLGGRCALNSLTNALQIIGRPLSDHAYAERLRPLPGSCLLEVMRELVNLPGRNFRLKRIRSKNFVQLLLDPEPGVFAVE